MGQVVDPEPLFPATVTMAWTDPCDVEVRAFVCPPLGCSRNPCWYAGRKIRFPLRDLFTPAATSKSSGDETLRHHITEERPRATTAAKKKAAL